MLILNLVFGVSVALAEPAHLPIFLKQGFSTVLEFESDPQKVVLGDGLAFQVEKLDHSLVIRALVPYATGNLFVFLGGREPRVFLLTASEDAEPTLYRKFESIKPPVSPSIARGVATAKSGRGVQLTSKKFDPQKDFLTLEAQISADSGSALRPAWDKVRIRFRSQILVPTQLWSERKEVQKDSLVRARFIFTKPNLPKDLVGAVLVVPLIGEARALSIGLGSRK